MSDVFNYSVLVVSKFNLEFVQMRIRLGHKLIMHLYRLVNKNKHFVKTQCLILYITFPARRAWQWQSYKFVLFLLSWMLGAYININH